MSWTTHTITTNYHGNTYNVYYWADGNGMETDGYVTDFPQFFDHVTGQFDNDKVELAFITEDGKLKKIADTKDLQSAVEDLDHDCVLSVKAFDKPSKGKRKGKGKTKRRNDDDDEESEGDDQQNPEPVYEKKLEKKGKNVQAILSRFVEQTGPCYECSKKQWTGRKYTYAYSSMHHMCGPCYNKLSKSYQEEWEPVSLPWEGDAPEAPLGDDYYIHSGVKHLQYLLTRFGYMKLADTASQTGSYQSKTESAVAAFREDHKITDGDMTLYDKKTQKKLAQVVKKMRKEGHSFLS